MKTFPSSRAIIAVAAIVALFGSVSVSTTDAAPLASGINLSNPSIGFGAEPRDHFQQQRQEAAAAVINNAARRLNKRQAQIPTHTEAPIPRQTTVTERPKPTAAPHTQDPAPPSNSPKATPKPPASSGAPIGTVSTVSGSTAAVPVATGTLSGAAPATTTAAGSSGDNGVPTQVSTKVFIGLGTVGGFFIFALGGLAFCRHRKKKNLASALLQQTAQFNNNNPYAKLPEPAASPKESLPMTPTKPLGTYNVVATYTPALADEIEIGLGDSVTILQEYDDGWCMGVNNTRGGAKGVFPRHCVEMGPYEGSQHGAPGGPHYPPSPSFKATTNKRISSIAPANGGWNEGQGFNGGGGGFPPQPNSQYLGPNQGGGGGGGFY